MRAALKAVDSCRGVQAFYKGFIEDRRTVDEDCLALPFPEESVGYAKSKTG